jgi:biopolymer transport protein ExbB
MNDLIKACGIFIYPLVLLSIAGLFIIIERLYSLRADKIIPTRLQNEIIEQNTLPAGEASSVIGRILLFHEQRHPDAEQIKAFAKMEAIGMERGLYILEIVIAVAPLIGLLGTSIGLVQVFSNVAPETGLPEAHAFASGVALPLATTVAGLTIAIPAVIFNAYLNRRIDKLTALLNVIVERIVTIDEKNKNGNGLFS